MKKRKCHITSHQFSQHGEFICWVKKRRNIVNDEYDEEASLYAVIELDDGSVIEHCIVGEAGYYSIKFMDK